MNYKTFLQLLFLISLISCGDKTTSSIQESYTLFNKDWQFTKDAVAENELLSSKESGNWETISLPHTANIEPLVIEGDQWQGNCYYKKTFTISDKLKNKHIALKFEGAMQVASIYLNGELITTHIGGYLPFYVDISSKVKFNEDNSIFIKLNNEDNPQFPPGKTISTLDFNIFSGIYRNVWMITKDKLHISDAIDANKTAGGGVFITYSQVSKESATMVNKVEVINEDTSTRTAQIKTSLKYNNEVICNKISDAQTINQGEKFEFIIEQEITNPKLWSPSTPWLYTLQIELYENGSITDREILKTGIRTIKFSAENGFEINGETLKLRGTNRHQEYPYIGYALSDNANYRDAYKIKEAGFNFVRLSHYPQSNAFINACDELGILVMDAIPGWQFFGDSIFQENAIKDVRNMMRRDRNHPSIILWEASLNESAMTQGFMQRAHDAVHEEFPGEGVYTCGWLDSVYDVFIPARQHAKPPHYWNNYSKDKPIFIAEYGDWEYYAQNAGFNQKAYQDLSDAERNSRQLRKDGQKRLLQQALNYQESHNSNLYGPATGDANWLMFDYNRGYAPDIEASGIMDIFRLPKFAFDFYKSQANVGESTFAHPMVSIANYYDSPSLTDIRVYSNCDEVELFVNGESILRQKPDSDSLSTKLTHPPFTFNLKSFAPGMLVAKGYINGEVQVTDTARTPKNATAIKLWMDESGKQLTGDSNDVVFLYAAIVDENGTIIPTASASVQFTVDGDAQVIGMNPIEAEAGISTVVLKAGAKGSMLMITAQSEGLKTGILKLKVN